VARIRGEQFVDLLLVRDCRVKEIFGKASDLKNVARTWSGVCLPTSA
jgi:hypothetical protein